jgi:hypothetical protein
LQPINKTDPFYLDIVIPRCCEEGLETYWIDHLLESTSIRVTFYIYYKCPSCLPRSHSVSWINNLINNNSVLRARSKRGINILNDNNLIKYGNRVHQVPNFDTIYNGKEVSAYLQHIITNYDNLANQTLFLHTVPHAHILFSLFYRTIRWAERCNTEINFLHLNAKYKYGIWGDCCGKYGACRLSTHEYLFNTPLGDIRPSIKTYSSAQFTASRTGIQDKSLLFWNKMLRAINGSHDLVGCVNNSETGVIWGGHSLTGQYERMWHMIFGSKPTETKREDNKKIPKYFRQDCGFNVKCEGAV